jgi:hypothetical protein
MIFLVGCTTFKPDFYEKPKLRLEDPAPIVLNDVKFVVVTKENAGAVFRELEKNGDELVVFGLTGRDYKNLSMNMQEIKNYIILQKEIIESYRKYYESE